MTPARVVLAEDEQDEVVADLDAGCAAAIEASGLVRVEPLGAHRWRLVPRGRVGAVHVEDVDVVVTPKVGIARLLFLLGYAADPGFRPEDVEGVADEDLWPAIAETLRRHAERALLRGVLQGYVTEEDALPLVRGRIRVADQIARRPGMMLPVEVRYDEYSVDIAENRLLRTALRRVLTVSRLHLDIRARLSHLDARLDGVTPLVAGTATPGWRPSRINARYQAALRMSELVLRHQSFEIGPGGLRVAAFVVDMAKVFEDFVATALREAWQVRPGATWTQYASALDAEGTVRMKVDVVHVVNGRPVIVADAKYKLESSSGRYPNADHYQMLAYCTALAVPTGWLIYARGNGVARQHRVVNAPIDIFEYPLDLSAAPSSLLAQVQELSDRSWTNVFVASSDDRNES